jgi:hypothetical protein
MLDSGGHLFEDQVVGQSGHDLHQGMYTVCDASERQEHILGSISAGYSTAPHRTACFPIPGKHTNHEPTACLHTASIFHSSRPELSSLGAYHRQDCGPADTFAWIQLTCAEEPSSCSPELSTNA